MFILIATLYFNIFFSTNQELIKKMSLFILTKLSKIRALSCFYCTKKALCGKFCRSVSDFFAVGEIKSESLYFY